MAIIYFTRHAQASFGTEDYDRLSPLGRQQARWLGEYFAARGLKFKRVIAGTLTRQRDTASEIVGVLGGDRASIETHPGLNEYEAEAIFRCYTGIVDQRASQLADFREYWKTFRAAMSAWSTDRLTGMPESWGDFGQRIARALAHAGEGAARDDAILVVSSGGAIGRGVADIIGSPAPTAIEFNLQFRNSGFCELIVGSDTKRLLSFNSIPHLEPGDRRHAITFA